MSNAVEMSYLSLIFNVISGRRVVFDVSGVFLLKIDTLSNRRKRFAIPFEGMILIQKTLSSIKI